MLMDELLARSENDIHSLSANHRVRRETRVLNSLMAITDSVSADKSVCRMIQRLFAKRNVIEDSPNVSETHAL